MGIFWELYENKRIWVIDGNMKNLMGIFLELDENKRILMVYRREQEEIDGNFLGT
jgi:hypothetical protein